MRNGKIEDIDDESMRAPEGGDSPWLGHDFNGGHLGACRVISIKPDQKWPSVGVQFQRRGRGEIYRVVSVGSKGADWRSSPQIEVERILQEQKQSRHTDQQQSWTQTPTPTRFKLVPFRDLVPGDEPAYLVDGLIPRVGLAVVWGPPKCGKSFWVFDLALHVALGWQYRGRRIETGHVIYCAFEGASGFKNRAEAFRRRHLVGKADPHTFHLMPARTDLVADHVALIASLRNELGDNVPAAVVLDTLNRSLAGSESKDEDMGAYVKAADAIREAFDCVVIVVHHCGIEASRPRGHTSLTGAVDAQLAVKRDAAKTIFVEVEWMKDGEEGAVLVSKLDNVTVGANRHGQDITSCVVVPVEGANIQTTQTRVPEPAKLAMRMLVETLADFGTFPPASNHIPPDTRTCTVEQWRQRCYATSIAESDKPDSKRKAFVRASKTLQAIGFIGVWNDQVWLAGHAGQGRT
jgi:hypothetical protein